MRAAVVLPSRPFTYPPLTLSRPSTPLHPHPQCRTGSAKLQAQRRGISPKVSRIKSNRLRTFSHLTFPSPLPLPFLFPPSSSPGWTPPAAQAAAPSAPPRLPSVSQRPAPEPSMGQPTRLPPASSPGPPSHPPQRKSVAPPSALMPRSQGQPGPPPASGRVSSGRK